MVFTRTTNQLEVLSKLQIPYIHFLPTEMVRDSASARQISIRLKKQKNQLNKLVILIKLVYPDISSQDREYLEITLHKYASRFQERVFLWFLTSRSLQPFRAGPRQWSLQEQLQPHPGSHRFSGSRERSGIPPRRRIRKSLGESHYRADLALQEAIKYGKNDGFVISGEDNALTGPLSLTRSLNYSYSNTKLWTSQSNGINRQPIKDRRSLPGMR